ncbi:PulJ/GspJ family protein [Paraconexibacter antarcticus]|nr:prepilin-type N-terminal cleavage/methylation domain-containing protein [Paraconexibacter antarcticus]
MRRHETDDRGFTMIEVMFAMLVSTLTVVATVSVLTQGSGTTLSNVRQVTVTQRLQAEIEKVRSIVPESGFGAVALSSAPTGTAATPRDPRYWLRASNTQFVIASNYASASSGVASGTPGGGETLVTSASGQIAPVTSGVSLGGGQTATIYRYVTVDSQTVLCSPACANDSRRVTIAIVPVHADQNATDATGPFYLSTVITNRVPSSTATGGNGLELGVSL